MLTKVFNLKNLKTTAYLAGTASLLYLCWYYAIPLASAQADPTDNIPIVDEWTGGATSFRTLAKDIVNFFLYFLGFIATLMIIYAGILYVTAQGEQEKIDSAKKMITYAVIGIVVILLSFALVNTVLSSGQTGGQPSF